MNRNHRPICVGIGGRYQSETVADFVGIHKRAATKRDALAAYDDFLALYEEKYPKAFACLRKDKEVLFTFYDFPAAQWKHLRTTNPIESTFATVRHRTRQTKGCGSRQATLTMVYKLGREAEKHWRSLDGHQLMVKVLRGVRFVDGEERADDRRAASRGLLLGGHEPILGMCRTRERHYHGSVPKADDPSTPTCPPCLPVARALLDERNCRVGPEFLC